MDEATQRLWIIPGKGLEDHGLEDGVPVFYEGGIGNKEHRELMEDFCKKYNIDDSFCNTHHECGKYLAFLGMIIFFNSGNINGKRAGAFYLPRQLSMKQIEFFENRKDLLREKFHENISFFEARVLPSGELPYRTTDGLRDLKIESIIECRKSDNGQELLFRELKRQKEALKEHENKI